MTTPHPRSRARFYIMLDTSNTSMFTPGEEPLTFTLSAGTKFPSDLSVIMKKTGRYLSATSSDIAGMSEPKCEGDGCECLFCKPDSCAKEYCLENTTDTTNFLCSKESCARTNDMKYYMLPLYPAKEFYLSEYNAKFRFIKFIPSQKVEKRYFDEITNKYVNEKEEDQKPKNQLFGIPPGWSLPPGMTIPPGDFIPYVGTIPPGETPPPGWRVLPGMIIPPGGVFPPNFMTDFAEPPSGEERTVATNLPRLPPSWTPPPGLTMPPPGRFIPYVGTIHPDETFPPGWQVLPGMIIFPYEIPNNMREPPTMEPPTLKEEPTEIQLPEFVVFSITYPSMSDFDTNDKFLKLYESIMPFNLGFLFFKEERFLQHNIAVLQQILRVNRLPKTLLDPKKIKMTSNSSHWQSVKSDDADIERYDNDIKINDLKVPISPQEDTDDTSDDLITPEPDGYVEKIEEAVVSSVRSIATTSTAPPRTSTRLPIIKQQQNVKKTTKKGLSVGAKVGIAVGVIAVIAITYGAYTWKKKKQQRR